MSVIDPRRDSRTEDVSWPTLEVPATPRRIDECIVYRDADGREWMPAEVARRAIAERDEAREELERVIGG